MYKVFFVLALAARVYGLAVDLSLARRDPFTTYTSDCEPGWNAITDSQFAGDGSAFGNFTVTGDLQVHSAFGQTYGLKSDTDSPKAL